MKLVLNLFLVLSWHLASCQALVIDDTVVLKRGIYRSFKEFKYNQPGLSDEFDVVLKTRGYNFFNATLHNAYSLVLKEPKSIQKKDSLWGFCDGTNLYINNGKVYSKRNIYERIIFKGRYCTFETVESSGSYAPMMVTAPTMMAGGGMMMGGGGGNRILTLKAVNMNNGTVFEVNKATLKEILQKDPEMLEQFNAEKRKKKETVYDYFLKFCRKHIQDLER